MTGKFITLEGIEGCGKTNQVCLLEKFLVKKGHKVVLTREPGGTPIGDQIRKILMATENKRLCPVAELLLYAAGRNQHVEELICPSLRAGKIVVCDRYADATEAYQGAARRIDRTIIDQMYNVATGGLKPDLTILLDCPAKIGLKRARERNIIENKVGVEDRFEQEELEFHERVRRGYLDIAKREPNRVKVIDASGSIEEVHQNIIKEVVKVIA